MGRHLPKREALLEKAGLNHLQNPGKSLNERPFKKKSESSISSPIPPFIPIFSPSKKTFREKLLNVKLYG